MNTTLMGSKRRIAWRGLYLLVGVASVLLVLTACSGEHESPRATHGPQMANPLERLVLQRLARVDEGAHLAEREFDSAAVELTLGTDPIQVYVHRRTSDVATPGRVKRRESINGIEAGAVRLEGFGEVWRFDCNLKGFGSRPVDIAFAKDPASAVQRVHAALRCGS